MPTDFQAELAQQRSEMVDAQLRRRGIRDERVLRAMEIVPRHEFVPWQLQREAYQDSPVPIGEGQTISQPYIVAHMLEALRLSPGDRVLEVGTGTGYEAAVISRIVQEVYTIERFASLAEVGKEDLRSARIHEHSRGDRGWKPRVRGQSAVRRDYCGRRGSARP